MTAATQLAVSEREAPCPFCGNVGITIREGSTFRWRVAECNHCGATCGEVRFNTMADDKLVEEISAGRRALDEWNTRQHGPEIARALAIAARYDAAEHEIISGERGDVRVRILPEIQEPKP